MNVGKVIAAAGLALGLGAVSQEADASTVLSGTATADNAFFAYVSTNPATLGTLIGSGNDWGQGYGVSSAALSPGTYYLEIEAINYGLWGGFSGVFDLSGNAKFANGTQTLTTGPSDLSYWLGSYNNSNSSVVAQPWVQPIGTVLQDAGYPWGSPAGTPYWIWPTDSWTDPVYGACQYCTVDLDAKFTVAGGVPEPSTWAMLLSGFGALGFLAHFKRQKQFRAPKAA